MSPTVSPLVPHANPGPSPTQSERGGDTLTRHAHAHAYARARTRTCTHAQGAKLGPDAWGTVGPVPSLPHSLFLVPLVHTLAPPPPPFPQPPPNTVLSSGPLLQPLSPGPLGLLLHVPGSFPHSSATPHSAWHTYISPSAPLPCHPSVFLFSHPFPSRPPPGPHHTHTCPSLSPHFSLSSLSFLFTPRCPLLPFPRPGSWTLCPRRDRPLLRPRVGFGVKGWGVLSYTESHLLVGLPITRIALPVCQGSAAMVHGGRLPGGPGSQRPGFLTPGEGQLTKTGSLLLGTHLSILLLTPPPPPLSFPTPQLH